MQIIDKLFSKACKDLQEGRFKNGMCFLFFSDGYSPLFFDGPESRYLEFARGIISSLKPELYVYIYKGIDQNRVEIQGAQLISAVVVCLNKTSWLISRAFKEVDGKIQFTSDTVPPSSFDMKITGRASDLYQAPNLPPETVEKMKVIVGKVSAFLDVAKIPYSHVIKNRGW